MVVLEILEQALQFVQKCPVDSRIIDHTFPTLACPICGTAYCMSPCAERLVSKNKKCPKCKKFEMSRLAEIIQNTTYRARLEELKVSQRASDRVYDKLRLEYEVRQRDAIARIYAKSPEGEAETKAYDATQRQCVSCGKEILQESMFCEFCGSRQPRSH
jgi:predicted RNA-binding Zn-ribbon protein involved in translation (DUF1610 family)